ncbi:hypothetical protein [Fodinicurvata halophila]|uniref:hypothetical protein n=1 Tax=Fodinicurvata halophila TaxID=1419723 RepID=UPI003643331E
MKLWPFAKGRSEGREASQESVAEEDENLTQNQEEVSEAEAGMESEDSRQGGGFMPNLGRIGIRARLYCAFGGVVALTLLASGVAWFSYGNVEQAYGSATQRDVPAMNASLRLRGMLCSWPPMHRCWHERRMRAPEKT